MYYIKYWRLKKNDNTEHFYVNVESFERRFEVCAVHEEPLIGIARYNGCRLCEYV